MRIAHFLQRIRLEDGGVARATIDLCGALAARGHEVTLITCEARDVPEPWKRGESGCPRIEEIPPLTGPLKLLTRWSKGAIERVLNRVVAAHIHEIWEPCAAQVAQIARQTCTPYVVSAHGMLDHWSMAQSSLKKQAYLRLVGNRMFRGAGAIHFTAEGEAAQAAARVPSGRSGVVPLILDLEPYRVLPDRDSARASLPGDPNRRSTAFLGRLHPKKGLESLIEAAGNLAGRGMLTELLIAGTGDPAYEQTLKNLALHRGIADRTHFLGHIVGQDKTRLLRGADMLILPSYQENFGLVLVEALACGTPVVTTKAVDIWPELQGGGGAVIIEDPAVHRVEKAMELMIRNDEHREAMGQRGRRWVFDHLNTDEVLNRFEGLYSRLVSGSAIPAQPVRGLVPAVALQA